MRASIACFAAVLSVSGLSSHAATGNEAVEMLRFHHNKGARLLEAVLKSAMGNAEDQASVEGSALTVSESRVDGAPMMKRIQPRARGSAYPIKRRYCHIVVSVATEAEATKA